MQFSGEITPEIEEEFRNLYYKRHPGFIIFWACLGLAIIALSIYILNKLEFSGGLLGILIGTVLFISAFTLPQIYWRLWWKQFQTIFGKHLFCEVTSAGLRWLPNEPMTEWKYFIATKQTRSIVLFYLNKATAYPLHRSMAASESDWVELLKLAKEKVHRKWL